jgi:hypothetical protein
LRSGREHARLSTTFEPTEYFPDPRGGRLARCVKSLTQRQFFDAALKIPDRQDY